MDDVFEMEQWPLYSPNLGRGCQVEASRDYFACSHCARLRAAKFFANNMMRRKRNKENVGSSRIPVRGNTDAWTRLCLDCWRETSTASRGAVVKYGGRGGGTGFVCINGDTFEDLWWETALAPPERDRKCRACMSESERQKWRLDVGKSPQRGH